MSITLGALLFQNPNSTDSVDVAMYCASYVSAGVEIRPCAAEELVCLGCGLNEAVEVMRVGLFLVSRSFPKVLGFIELVAALRTLMLACRTSANASTRSVRSDYDLADRPLPGAESKGWEKGIKAFCHRENFAAD